MATVVALSLAFSLAVLVLVRQQARRRHFVPERLIRIGLETARSRHRVAALTRSTLRSLHTIRSTDPSSADAERRAGTGGAR